MPLSDHVATHSFSPKKDVSYDAARKIAPQQTVILSDRPLHFDPTPKCVYFGLDVIMAMVGDAFTRAGVPHAG